MHIRRRSALDAGAFASVEHPRDDDGNDGESDEVVECGRDILIGGGGVAEEFRNEERAVGGDRRGEARDERSMYRILKDEGNHAERSTVDEARREEEGEESAEE